MSAPAHQRDGRTGRAQTGEHVELEDLAELAVRCFEASTATAAGVIDEDVQSAELCCRSADKGFHLAGHRHVGGLREDA